MEKKEWQEYSGIFKELLSLEYSPVAISCLKESALEGNEKKLRACRAILDAGKGAVLRIGRKNNACFGASWHMGFVAKKHPRVEDIVKKFAVEGEKLFCSYAAMDKLVSQMDPPPDNADSVFLFSPMEKSETCPELVIFIVNPEAACRLLTFITFLDGVMPQIRIGGPTCRMSVIYPLVTGEVNLSFYDHTARKMCNMEKDKLIISIPYERIPKIIESIDRCSAGRAKMELPAA